ncbi:tetratricopeptide repeat protein [Allomuricauda sp. NBRC 101325]|uniref:tetratricopeptide repeat-containing sensor histidine kinase n=1 Tax=Allomuricauda sp. NBRC 101325 TaxID=1113758 RepID=UPI0024A40250|nr:tetratricopeptide repeat protein [Muricauda sp. NBRC 101325]GLU44964.1 hypothetical protein Musp01_25880 [Muricauda sp. NBRC 101325]
MKPNQTLFPTLWVVLLIGHFCLSQTKELDSLQNLMKTADDTTQVNLLRLLGIKSRYIDKEKAAAYGILSLKKSKEIEFKSGEAKALYSLGLTYGITDNYAISIDYLKQGLKLANQIGDYNLVREVYKTMGLVYKNIGDYPASQESYLTSIKISDSFNLKGNTASIYINLGVLYGLMNDNEKAISSYKKALEIDGNNLSYNVEFYLAILYLMDGDYQGALDKSLKILPYWEQQGKNTMLFDLYGQIGHCYLQLDQFDNSKKYLLKALELANELSLKQGHALTYQNLTSLMIKQKKYEEAVDYSNKNFEVLETMQGAYERKREAHNNAYKIYEQSNQLNKAIFHLNKAQEYKDSLMNETKIKEIQNLQIRHDVYIKDRELKENELQMALLGSEITLNNKRMLYLFIISLLLLFSASLLYIRFRSKKKSNAVLLAKNTLISEQNLTIESMNRELEKRMLRAQMNPHFIFNSLNSIQSLIHANDRENALNYLCKFSRLLRQVLESSINISLLLSEEIKLLKIYVELEALRFDNSFQYAFHIDENLDVDAHEVPMLLVQPYIENAIIHGLMPKEGAKQLNLYFNDSPEFIECIIEDNGVGITSTKRTNQNERISRGMSITEKRIESLGKFTNLDLVQIENLNNGTSTGTRVTILIPKDE